MPTYTYRCEDCSHEFEQFFKTFGEKQPDTCPSCNAQSLEKLIDGPLFRIKGVAKTFGQQAEINAKKLGKEQMQLMEESHKTKKPWTGPVPKGARLDDYKPVERETPFWRSGEVEGTPISPDKPVDISNIKDPKKYILTGDKN